MQKYENSFGCAPNSDVALSRKGQATKILGQVAPILYDLADIVNKLNVSPKTIYNWRVKGSINLIPIGGKLYLTQKMFNNLLEGKEVDYENTNLLYH